MLPRYPRDKTAVLSCQLTTILFKCIIKPINEDSRHTKAEGNLVRKTTKIKTF